MWVAFRQGLEQDKTLQENGERNRDNSSTLWRAVRRGGTRPLLPKSGEKVGSSLRRWALPLKGRRGTKGVNAEDGVIGGAERKRGLRRGRGRGVAITPPNCASFKGGEVERWFEALKVKNEDEKAGTLRNVLEMCPKGCRGGDQTHHRLNSARAGRASNQREEEGIQGRSDRDAREKKGREAARARSTKKVLFTEEGAVVDGEKRDTEYYEREEGERKRKVNLI